MTNLFAQPLDKFRPLWTRAYKMHVALQYAPQLRDFVETRGAQEVAHARDPRVIVGSPSGASVGFRVVAHRAELVTVENLPSSAYALLPVKSRTRRTKLDGEHNKWKQGQRKHKSKEGDGEIKQAPRQPKQGAKAKSFRKNQPAGVQLLDFNPARDSFQPGRRLFDLRTCEAQVQQFFDRQ